MKLIKIFSNQDIAKCFGVTRFKNRQQNNLSPSKTNKLFDINNIQEFENEMKAEDPCLDFHFYLKK